jgi:hypothetical protein
MLDTLRLQKQERDQLLSKTYIIRDGIDEAKKYLDSNLIKVIIGPRRAGKSIFGFLLLKNANFAYLNFDDEKLLKITDFDNLLSMLSLVYPNFKYVFFDEIQNLPNWELLVNKMQRRGFNIILTGSNSKLLSGELASNLTGRYSLISVFPLSFDEVKNYRRDYKFTDYLMSGGYPEVVINNLDPRSYLKTLFEAILFKDVTKRYNLRHPQKIYELASYLLTNFASVYSFHNLKDAIGLSSVATTQKYVGLLEQTFLFFSLTKFDFKLKKQFGYNKKIYSIDNGMVSSVGFQNSENFGRLLENVVFGKLIRQGLVPNKDIFYYKTKSGKEVDFLIKNGIKIEKLIQVSLSLDDAKTKKREIASLLEASKELKCDNLEIITLDEEGFERGIKIKRLNS